MLNTLLESARPHRWPLGSVVASVGIHLMLGVPALQRVASTEVTDKPESFITRALFLPPPDRRPADGPVGERISWAAIGAITEGDFAGPAGAGGGRIVGTAVGDSPTGTTLAPDAFELVGDPLVIGTDTAYSIFQVDETVSRYADSDGPLYPNDLLAQNVEGAVFMRYVVDSTGSVDTSRARVVSSTHPQFTDAVLAALARMRFRPGTIANRPVSQLVEQEFAFRIAPAAPAGRTSPAGSKP